MEVQPQLYRIYPTGPECMSPEGERLLPPYFPLGQYYVHPGEGRPLPLKDVRRDPQQGKEVPVAIEESIVSPKILEV